MKRTPQKQASSPFFSFAFKSLSRPPLQKMTRRPWVDYFFSRKLLDVFKPWKFQGVGT